MRREAPDDVADRPPVWSALSTLYLDAELDDGDLEAVAGVLARSPWTVDELREIDLWEVAPVLWPNLLAVAGAWSGFDDEWLHAACGKRATRRTWLLRAAMPLGFRRFVRRATREAWARLAPMIEAARTPGPDEAA